MAEGAERFQGRIGTTIREKWHVDAFLSAGSMAAVYAATHRNGMRGALKILHKHLSRDAGLKKRFLREAYLANKVNHPCALRVLDDDVTEDGAAFLVMELLDGETLEARRQRVGRMELLEVLDIGDQLLDTLVAAHEVNVVHRDLKPENVLILKNGTIKVLDFGIAQVWDGARSSEMTETGTILGSPSYMPPEQARGARDEVNAQSDLWAVGATLFTLLAGDTVHPGDNAHAKLIATASRPARSILQAAPDLPRPVAAVIDRALAFNKKDRWPDASAMREALRWAAIGLGGTPATRRPSSGPPPKKHSEETLTDFDVNLVAARARSLPKDHSGDTTMMKRRLEAAPTMPAFAPSDLRAALLPPRDPPAAPHAPPPRDPAQAASGPPSRDPPPAGPAPTPRDLPNATYSETAPTIRRRDPNDPNAPVFPPPQTASAAAYGTPLPPPVAPPRRPQVAAVYARAPTSFVPPPKRPRLLGFLIGAAALLATALVGGSLALRGGAPATASPVATVSSGVADAAIASLAVSAFPSATAAPVPAGPSASASTAPDPAAAMHAELDQKPALRTVTPADLPAAPVVRPRPRRRPAPTPAAAGAEADAGLPSFPIPEPDPAAPTGAPASTAAPRTVSSSAPSTDGP